MPDIQNLERELILLDAKIQRVEDKLDASNKLTEFQLSTLQANLEAMKAQQRSDFQDMKAEMVSVMVEIKNLMADNQKSQTKLGMLIWVAGGLGATIATGFNLALSFFLRQLGQGG